jgi:acyl dehydratase
MAMRAGGVEAGQTREAVVVEDLKRTRIVQYAGASGDFNPLHTDEVYAGRAAGYPGVFAHGMLTMALAGRVVTDWVGVEALTAFGARFKAQVWPGDTLTTTVRAESVDAVGDGREVVRFTIGTRNQAGVEVLSGTASAFLEP